MEENPGREGVDFIRLVLESTNLLCSSVVEGVREGPPYHNFQGLYLGTMELDMDTAVACRRRVDEYIG